MSHPGQARGSNHVHIAHILLLVFFAVLFTIVSAQFAGGAASAQSNGTSPASTNANNPTPGNISTIAGNGNREFGSGDGLDPFGMAVDGAGNVYIADLFNHRIRKVDPNGVMTTVAGNGVQGFSGDGGPAVSASLNFPHDVAIDAAGNLYIADLSNNRIRKVDPNGIISTVVGNGAGEFSGDGGPATSASLWGPKGVTIDSGGTLYIADFNNGRVRKVDTNGIITTVAGNGSNEYSGDGGPATSVGFFWLTDVEADEAGNLYLADEAKDRIYKVDPNGIITTIAGNGVKGFSGDGGAAANASLSASKRIALDTDGNLYISDSGNHRVRKVDSNGIITTVAGNGADDFSGDGGPATSAGLAYPNGITVDKAGNLYVGSGNRIRKVASLTAPATLPTVLPTAEATAAAPATPTSVPDTPAPTITPTVTPEPTATPIITPEPQLKTCTQEDFLQAVKDGEQIGTITLDGACRYVLTAAGDVRNGGSGAFLSQATAVEGNGATIERSLNAPPFRIFDLQVPAGVVIRDLTIRNGNSTTNGGAIYSNTDLTLENVTLEGNSAPRGGALTQAFGRLVIDNGRLFDNHATDLGGAIFLQSGTMDITNTIFGQNRADSGNGAAVFVGGAVTGDARITNSTITDNAGNTGAAITTWGALDLRNTIVANHKVGLAVGGTSRVTDDHNLFANTTIDVRELSGKVSLDRLGASYVAPDARFVDAAARNYSLQKSSPAVDRGTASVLGGTALATDAGSNTRPYTGTAADIGAYEFQGEGGPSLAILKQGPIWINADIENTFSLVVSNDGIAAADAVAVVDVLPAGATYVDGSATAGGVFAGDRITWQLGTLAPGDRAYLEYAVKASQTLVSQEYSAQSTSDPSVIATGATITTTLNDKLVAAINFFPRPDGFSFPNYGGSSPDSDLTVDDMVKIFGETEACKVTGPCVLTAKSENWRTTWLKRIEGGHCAGMAMGSLNIFANDSLAANDLQSDANTTFDLTKENARRYVAFYASTQGAQPANAPQLQKDGYVWIPADTPAAVLDTLIKNLGDPAAGDRYRLSFELHPADGGGNGHTVVPYAVEQLNNDEYLIYIYENNLPNRFDVALRINRTTQEWTYVGTTAPDKPLEKYRGDATSNNLRLMSWRYHTALPKDPGDIERIGRALDNKLAVVGTFQSTAPAFQSSSMVEFDLSGEGYLLITRSDGKRAGFDLSTGQWISEIEGAQEVPIALGMGLNTPSAVHVPHSAGMTYSVQVASRDTAFGNTQGAADVNIAGPGFGMNVKDLVLDAPVPQGAVVVTDVPDLMALFVDPDNKRLTFTPGTDDAEAPTLTMAVSYRSGSDYSVDVRNVQVAPGHTVGLTFDENTNTIAIESNGADPVTYQVDVKRINSDGAVDQFSDGVSRGGAAGVRLMVGEEWTGDGAPIVETIQESTLPAPTVVQEELALLDAAQNNTYAVESNAGGDESPWLPDGVWVIGGRQDQRVVTLNITSDDGGQTLAGTMTYAGEGPIALRANKTEQNVYRVEVQWGGADAPWNLDGTWVLGARADQSVVTLELGSDDDGNTLDGTVSYADGSFFGFRATLQPASTSDELDATATEAEETGAAPEPTSSGEAPAAEETAEPTPEPAAELSAAPAQADRFPLLPGQTVEREQKIPSESGDHYLIFQPDGNVVVHTVDDQYVWGLESVTDKYAQAQSVKMETDGNFVVRGANDVYIWSALTENPDPSAYLTLTPEGVLRLVSGATGATLWASDGDLSPVAPTVEPAPEATAQATPEATTDATADATAEATAEPAAAATAEPTAEATPELPATVTDADGNVYPTVRVGDQLWMAENLRTATCSDGAAIPLVSDQDAWVTQTDAAYTWGSDVAGDAQAEAEYGALYNGNAAALPCNVCPSGWRVPSQADFQTLLDGQGADAHLKLSDPAFWGPDSQATNASGWSARPAGGAGGDTPGSYDFGQYAYFWSATSNTEDTNYLMVIHGADAGADGVAGLRYGFSIRCVQDLPAAEPTEESSTHTHPVHWSYAEGPENWEGVCRTGESQSPIDIATANAKDLPNIVIHYEDSDLRIMNNGHTVLVDFSAPGGEPRSYVEVVDANGEPQRYDLAQFHYHAPSEHTVDGKPPFAAELHLVHQNAAKENKVVIGILLEEGTANPAYQPFLANLPIEISEKPTLIPGVTINPTDLLPSTQTTFRYSGSLTTPPCTQDISWIVMTTPVQLSADQLKGFESVFDFHNNRPVQPLNARPVEEDTTP